jgi:hypothetical protein
MEKTVYDPTKHSVYCCSEGIAHDWAYRKDTAEYMCKKCGLFIDKDTLKKETD